MEGVQQDNVLKIVFTRAVERENLLMEKYLAYGNACRKNAKLKELVDEFKKEAADHLVILREKMTKLKI